MIEGWAAVAAAAVTVAGGVASSRSAKKQSKFEAQMDKEMVPLQGLEERRNIAFDYEFQDYMNQRERGRRANAFAGLAKQFGGTGVAPTIEAIRPTDPNPTGAVPSQTPVPMVGTGTPQPDQFAMPQGY
jgi:hypothetical protein